MAKVLNYEGQIVSGSLLRAAHVSQSVEAFTGAEDYDIKISGSLALTGSVFLEPTKILTTEQNQLLTYNSESGQIFYTSSDNLNACFHVYQTGSGLGAIKPVRGDNLSNGLNATIGGGTLNTASSGCTTVAGGCGNKVISSTAFASSIGGGQNNCILADYSIGNSIGGGATNYIHAGYVYGNTIGGGNTNCILLDNCTCCIGSATIGGGSCNTVSANNGSILGGKDNTVSGRNATIVSGFDNIASGDCSFIGAGSFNLVTGNCSAILGGIRNTASNDDTFIIGSNLTSSASCTLLTNKVFSTRTGFTDSKEHTGVFRTTEVDGSSKFPGGVSAELVLQNGGNLCKIAIVPGTYSSELMTNAPRLAFYAGSDMDTSNATGFQAIIISGSSGTCMGIGKTTITNALEVEGNISGSGTFTMGVTQSNTGTNASIAGGSFNTSSGAYTFIGSGQCNYAQGTFGFVGGGLSNRAGSSYSGVVSGLCNRAGSFAAFVGGGCSNLSLGNCYTSIVGGRSNCLNTNFSFIGGGTNNTICNTRSDRGINSAIVVGIGNVIINSYSFIGGGSTNCITNCYSAIVGGISNINHSRYGFLGGGQENIIGCQFNSSIGGGYKNIVTSSYSHIGGGFDNCISGSCSFIGGGAFNLASGDSSVVVGGKSNCALCDNSGVLGGLNNAVCHNSSFIIGSDLTSSAECTTFVNNLNVEGTTTSTTGSFDKLTATEFNFSQFEQDVRISPQTIFRNISIPTSNNATLIGPVGMACTLTIGLNSNAYIIPA